MQPGSGNQSTLPGSQNPLAPSDGPGQDPSATSPLNPGTQPHSSVTPETYASTAEKESPNTRYERHLLAKGHGFPLWAPQPHSRLPLSYRRKGVSVGDVGIITQEGSFDFLFNICLPRGHPNNPRVLPANFSPVYLLPTDILELRQHDSGSCLLTPSTEKLRGLTFKRKGPEGSMLVMPNGAYHENLLSEDKFNGALQNAENWYRFAIGTWGRKIENGGLRLVTGCDKTNLWGIATYSDFGPGTIKLAANTTLSPAEYTWEYEGRVEAKAGPRPDESLDATGNQEYPSYVRNQCTFLRAYTITLADNVWKTMVSTLVRDSPDNYIFNSPEPRSYFPSILSGLFGGFGGGGAAANIHPASAINQMLLTQADVLVMFAFFTLMLTQYPNAKVAISHDNDWCAVIRKDEITMPDVPELLSRIQQTFMSHFDEDGTVYLSQKHAPEANSRRQSLSQDSDTQNEGEKLSTKARGKQSEGPLMKLLAIKPHSPPSQIRPSMTPHKGRPYILGAHETLQTSDIVIAVVATTGTGKTTFINNFAGALLPSSNSLHSSSALQAVVVPQSGFTRKRLVLVETPGCDHTSMKDEEIEVCVKNWLASKYKPGKLYGAILLHDLRRPDASTPFLLKYIKKHCGKDMCTHLMLAATRCDESRENIMAMGPWKDLIDKGATIFRLRNTAESALELVRTLLARDKGVSDPERLKPRKRQTQAVGRMTSGGGEKVLQGPLEAPSSIPGVSIADEDIASPPSRGGQDSSYTNSMALDHGSIGEDTIIIALMGASGTGKSSFINKLMASSVALVSDSVESCTQEVQAFTCRHPDGSGRDIVIIDTPGFDDTNRTDFEVLNIIALWLMKTYKQDIKLTGIIYLHSIADTRVRGTPLKNLKTFEQLCGSDALKNVILTTTFWDQVTTDIGLEREAQLKSEFWAEMITHGSRVARFNPWTYQSAWNIINLFDITASQRHSLRVQVEMVDQKKALHSTSAFRTLVNSLIQFVGKVKAKTPRSRRNKR